MRQAKGLMRISIMVLSVVLATLVYTRVQEQVRADAEAEAVAAAEREAALNPVVHTPEPTPEPTIDPNLPVVDLTSWELLLVNDLDYANYLSSNYAPDVVLFDGNIYFSARAVDHLQAMVDAMRAEGMSIYTVVGYRSYPSQEYLFNGKASQLSWDGTHTYEEAVELAKEVTAFPGTSEHQVALCVDFSTVEGSGLQDNFANSPQFTWLVAHCAEYGFIYRYPEDKTEETGRMWEPWHFRYVGIESATYIMEHDLTLEEYIALCQTRDAYEMSKPKEQEEVEETFTLISPSPSP